MICLAFAAISLADGLRAPARLPEAPADDASGHDLPRAGAGRAAASFLRLANASDSASVTANAVLRAGLTRIRSWVCRYGRTFHD